MRRLYRYQHFLWLSLLILVTRLPFASHILYSWDAVQFALALEDFDLAQHQPHPPGYILYIGLGKLSHLIFSDANQAFVVISMIASFLIALLFYDLLIRLTNQKLFAFLGTLILIFSPYFWYYGEVASTYIFDALFSILFVYLALVTHQSQQKKYIYLLSITLAIAGGFRESLLILFAPLWLFTLVFSLKKQIISWKNLVFNILLTLIILLGWFIPLLVLSGGWQSYWNATNWMYHHAANATSLLHGADWRAAFNNTKSVIKITLTALNILVLSPVLLLFLKFKSSFQNIGKQKFIIGIFALWLLPSYFLYTCIHFGNFGYLMTVSLGTLLIFLWPLFLFYQQKNAKFFLIMIFAIILVETATFLFLKGDQSTYTAHQIRDFDSKLISTIAAIKKYDPKTTSLVCGKDFTDQSQKNESPIPISIDYFRHLEYYLPAYHLYEIFPQQPPTYFHVQNQSKLRLHANSTILLPKHIESILIISDQLTPELELQSQAQMLTGNHHHNIFLIDPRKTDRVNYGNYEFIR